LFTSSETALIRTLNRDRIASMSITSKFFQLKNKLTATAGKPIPIIKLQIQLTPQANIAAGGRASCVNISPVKIHGIGP